MCCRLRMPPFAGNRKKHPFPWAVPFNFVWRDWFGVASTTHLVVPQYHAPILRVVSESEAHRIPRKVGRGPAFFGLQERFTLLVSVDLQFRQFIRFGILMKTRIKQTHFC